MDVINIEVMLLGWSESHNGGAKIVLQLADPDDLDRFRAMTVAKGKVAGQRLGAAFVEIGDDERPTQREPIGPLCRLAAQWCKSAEFQAWLKLQEPSQWGAWHRPGQSDEDAAARVVRGLCGVESRRALDTDPNAGRTFHAMIREPFMAYLGHRGE